ncbi:MAG: hypothetical protein V4543_13885 [Bacteroidota bacterium]
MLDFIKNNKEAITIIVATITAAVTIFSFIRALNEYRVQGQLKRAELVRLWFNLFLTDQRLQVVKELLEEETEGGGAALARHKFIDRYYFLGRCEEVAIAVNSGLIKKNVAYYLFGYFAIICWDSKYFWEGLPGGRDVKLWSVFGNFVTQMKEEREAFNSDPSGPGKMIY